VKANVATAELVILVMDTSNAAAPAELTPIFT
jgi:hypothetical protein